MKSITMYMFKKRFLPLVGLFFFLGFYGVKAQDPKPLLSSTFYDASCILENKPFGAYTFVQNDGNLGTTLNFGATNNAEITLPSNFNFNFYCQRISKLRVANNGILLIDDASTTIPASNISRISNLITNVISPLWDEWVLGSGNVSYTIKGVSGNILDPRRLVVHWQNLQLLGLPNLNATVDFWLELVEDTGEVVFYYNDVRLIENTSLFSESEQNLASPHESGRNAGYGMRTPCATGRYTDGVNNSQDEQDFPALELVGTGVKIRMLIFKPKLNACIELPIQDQTFIVCEDVPAFDLPIKTGAVNGNWEGNGVAYVTPNPTTTPDLNGIVAKFDPRDPGNFIVKWNPGCPLFSYNVNIRVDERLSLPTLTPLIGCNKSAFILPAVIPSVSTVSAQPQWTFVNSSPPPPTSPTFPQFSNNPITVKGVSGIVNLELTNGVCVTPVKLENGGGQALEQILRNNCTGTVDLSLPATASGASGFEWSKLAAPLTLISNGATATVSGLLPTDNVIVSVSYELGGICYTQEFKISGGGAQEATVGGSTNATQIVTQCSTEDFTLTALKPDDPAKGTWAFVGTPPNGVTMSPPSIAGNQVSVTVSGVIAGSFLQVSWTVGIPNINGGLDCSDAVVVTLTNDAPIEAEITGILSQCNDGTFNLTGVATPSVYTSSLWSKVSVANNITLSANLTLPTIQITGLPVGQSATLQWTVINGQCSSSTQVTIRNDMPISAGDDICVCQTDFPSLTVNLSATASTSFGSWSCTPVGALIFGTPNNSLTTTAQLSNASFLNQTIVARFTGPIGLMTPCPRFDEVNVKINSAVTASITGASTQCSGNGTFSLVGNTPLSPATGMWSKVGAGNITLPAILNQPNITVTGLPVGQTATLRWTVTNGACSSSTDIVLINARPTNVVLIDTKCPIFTANGALDLRDLIGTLNGDGVWSSLSTPAGVFSGGLKNIFKNGIGTIDNYLYKPTQDELDCGEIKLKLDVASSVCPGSSSAMVTVYLGTTIAAISDINLSISFNVNNCESTLTGINLLNSKYKHFRIVACRKGFVKPVDCGCNGLPLIPLNKIDKSHIGQYIGVVIMDTCNNMRPYCVKIEDKEPPRVTCPKDVAVFCNTLVALSKDVPQPSLTGDLGLDGITPPPPAMDGSVKDCSPIVDFGFIDLDCNLMRSCSSPFNEGNIPTTGDLSSCFKNPISLDELIAIRNSMIALAQTNDVVKFIIRCWTATDANGKSSAPCYQVIAIRRLPFKILKPADKLYSCGPTVTECNAPAAPASTASSTTGFSYVDMNNNNVIDAGDIALNTEGARACGMILSEKDEESIPCKGSKKITRTFTVTDECTGSSTQVVQNIEVLDLIPPKVYSEFTTYERVAKTYCYVNRFGVKQNKTTFEIVAKTVKLDDFTGKSIPKCDYNTEGVTQTLEALGDPNDCNRFFVQFRFVTCDHYCTNDLVTMFSNRSDITPRRVLSGDFIDKNGVPNYVWEFSGFLTATDLPFDSNYSYGEGECRKTGARCQDIIFYARDLCGNAIAKQKFRVYFIDNQKPNVVCITSHTATLTTNGTVRIAASTFNNGSTDNCSRLTYMVRRMDKKYFDPNTISGQDCDQPFVLDDCYRDYVEFTCAEANRDSFQVEMLATDDDCNTNACMVWVKVQNKAIAQCVPPAATETPCLDIEKKIASPKTYFGGEASAFYNCGYRVEEIAVTPNIGDCGVGNITRTWVVKACSTNTELSRCQQIITVTGKSDFTVDFPDDIVVSCQGQIPTIACLKQQMLDPTSWAKGYDGAIKNDGCGVIQISIKDDTLMANPNGLGCSVIYRKIWVSDDCKYQPNGTSSLTKGAVINGDVHGYSTNGRSLPCSVTGAITHPNSNNRRFRDADDLTGIGNNDGIICFIQTIKIEDNTPPMGTNLPTSTAVGFDKGQCTLNYRRTLSATDGCGGSTPTGVGLRYKWFAFVDITDKTGTNPVQIAEGETNEIAVDNLAAGVYTFKWFAKDLCNNSTPQYSYTLTVRDDEAPSIVGNLKVAALGGKPLGGNGMATVCLSDLLTNVNDNCTNASVLRLNARLVRESSSFIYPANLNDTCAMILCSDLADSARLVLWTKDEAGISNYARIAIKVQDNLGVCRSGGVAAVSGVIVNDKNVAIQNAQISASLKSNNVTLGSANTSSTGSFEINNLFTGQNYNFRATKEDEVYAGVTTLDISLISRHLLDIDKLKTPCNIIAADVDGNRSVDGADMLHMRNFILRKTSSLPAGAWKFIDKKYTFINPNEPLSEDFPELVSIENIAQNFSLGFTAVKVGDVNNTYRPQNVLIPAPRSGNKLIFTTDDMTLEAGKTYLIKLKASDFNASDYQFTLGITEGFGTVKSVEAGNLPNMGNGNFAVFKNAITTSWNGTSKESEVEALTLTFVANQNAKLSEVLTINSVITPMDATNLPNGQAGTEGSALKIQLSFGNNVVKEAGEFALYQNRPNPMSNTTAIGFNLPKESEATLTIYNIEGKAMKVVNSTFKAGYNEVTIEKETFQTAGIYYYRLETSEHSATKKMVVSF